MSIKVEFVLSSKELNVKEVDSIIDIHPSHTRTDFPPTSIATPEWWIDVTEDSLSVDKTVWSVAKRLIGKKKKIVQICKQYHVIPTLIITVFSDYANRPEFGLSPKTIRFFSSLSTEIIVDLESIYDQGRLML